MDAARVRHTHRACRLVKGLARRVVARFTEHRHLCIAVYLYNMAVSAADDKAQNGGFKSGWAI